MDHAMVDQSADREEHPYEKAERHERRGYGTEQSVSQGSQHGKILHRLNVEIFIAKPVSRCNMKYCAAHSIDA